jgi:hypothetical protein
MAVRGLGAALGTIGTGLIQKSMYDAEEMRRQNLENIRRQERGEEKAYRAQQDAKADSRYTESKERQEKMDASALADRSDDNKRADRSLAISETTANANLAMAKENAGLRAAESEIRKTEAEYRKEALEKSKEDDAISNLSSGLSERKKTLDALQERIYDMQSKNDGLGTNEAMVKELKNKFNETHAQFTQEQTRFYADMYRMAETGRLKYRQPNESQLSQWRGAFESVYGKDKNAQGLIQMSMP